MLKIGDKPILSYIIDYWRKYTNDFIFVVGYRKEDVINYVNRLPINSQFVEQKELKGIGHATLCAESLISDRFILVLGDCICSGSFDFPRNRYMEQGVGVWETSDVEAIKQSYSVEVRNNLIRRVVEKPKRIINNLCGMGFYFFDKRIFDFLKITKPSKIRNEIEITDAIQNMIDAGEKISPVFFHGDYINITYLDDLQKAENFLFREK